MKKTRAAVVASTEAELRGRFQLSRRQLVLVALTAAGLLVLNMGLVGPSVDEPTYGWPFVMYVAGKAKAHGPCRGKGPVYDDYATGVGVENGGRATIGARRIPGLQLDGLVLDPPFWFAVLALAWVIGDRSSLPRSVRDRLRKVKRRVAKDDGEGSVSAREVRV